MDGQVLSCRMFSSNPLMVDLKPPDSQCSVRSMLSQSGLLPSLNESGQFTIERALFPASGESLLMVQDATSPLDFWLQVHNSIAMEELGKLSAELQRVGSECVSLVSPLLLGQLCIAKFQQDKQWYRAQVIELLGVNRVKVRFLDYGNVTDVPADAVRLILSEHMVLPSQAINGALHGFGVDASIKKATVSFKSLTTDVVLRGSPRGHTFPDRVVVELNEWGGASLSAKLLQEIASKV